MVLFSLPHIADRRNRAFHAPKVRADNLKVDDRIVVDGTVHRVSSISVKGRIEVLAAPPASAGPVGTLMKFRADTMVPRVQR